MFLHAFPLHASMWEPAFESLPEGWGGIAPDLSGFGDAPPPVGPYAMSDYAADVWDLLMHTGIDRAVVCGCSMGGYVAFEMYRRAPIRVRGMVLVSTRADADSDEARGNRARTIEQVEREGVESLADQMSAKLIGRSTQAARPALVPSVRDLILAATPQGVVAALRAMMARPDSTDLLPRIAVPALIVHGDEDTLIPVEKSEEMHRAIPGSSHRRVEGCGHLPNLEQPETFASALGDFLKRL